MNQACFGVHVVGAAIAIGVKYLNLFLCWGCNIGFRVYTI